MKQKIYRVGTEIDDEFVEFATCTEYNFAEYAKQLLEGGGWENIEIRESNLFLNSITINNMEYDLSVSSGAEKPTENDGLQVYNVRIAVDGRCDVTVRAENFEDAKDKANTKVSDLDFGDLECIEWQAVNAENCETEEFHDF